ncbi:MAG: DegT/DnrJ/EryC1/StrS family aminotransferase [Dehalococcoidia bacterium]
MTTIKLVDLQAQFAPIKDQVLAQIEQVLDGMQLFLGENTFRLETEFAQFCQAKYAVGVGSGTDALYIALRACDIGPGDEVITVPNTFVATAGAIALAGARPVFVDIDPATHTMDPARLEAAITTRTKAVVPVHLYGQPADMAPILRICRERGLRVIEDACQAHGAEYDGRRTGTLGDIAAFSFYYAKNLGAYGEAGIVVTNDRALATKVQMLRNHGSKDRYHHAMLGINSRLDEIQAAILRVKLPRLEEANTRRRTWATEYAQRLGDMTDIKLPTERPEARHVYHLFVIETPRRDALRDWLSERGIETGVHYPVPLHLQEACAHLGYRQGSFPHAESAAKQVLSLPMYPELTGDQVSYVCQSIRDFFQRSRRKGRQHVKAGSS